ncbi:MAG TPA: hypothetical protein VG708_07275 [Mycobacteriales bacterium]|nr:hypothetical protein [Mycobacteriales bacterium]
MPVGLDEYPIHQSPVSMRYVATSDRNFYDRCYFNAHDRTGEIFFITGLGLYPNLGVKDAYACVRRGDRQHVLRCSDALDDNREAAVGPYRIEVVEPLQRIRLVCDADDLGFDLTWEGSFPAVDEERHLLRSGPRPIIDTWRFAQLGSWSGTLRVDGDEITVSPDVWVGSRDRSWGIRPIGEAEPAGRPPDESGDFGFWWLYMPMRFDDFAVVLIAQEDGSGRRTLNDAVRVHPDGRTEQLGWPRVAIDYRSGTRHPEHARIELTEPDGRPLVMEVDTLGFVPLHVGCGYGGDPDWLHGQWRGRGWVESKVYDFADPDVIARTPFGVIDHVGRATCNGQVGWGLFEHGTFGRHAPSGFADFGAVAK